MEDAKSEEKKYQMYVCVYIFSIKYRQTPLGNTFYSMLYQNIALAMTPSILNAIVWMSMTGINVMQDIQAKNQWDTGY